jgi:hypothetical protein
MIPHMLFPLESAPVKKFLPLLVLAAIACGKRGDPRPPVPVIPQATSDLVVTQRADRVVLSWSYPSLTTAGKSLKDVKQINVFRYVEELPVAPGGRDPKTLVPGDVDTTQPQPVIQFSKVPQVAQAQFVKLSAKIESIDKAKLADATTGARLFYTDTPAFRSSDGRPVRLTYAVVTEGGTARSQPSNLAVIVPLPVGMPPTDLAATTKAEGVLLSWKAPEKSVTGADAPIVTGYNVYRNAPNSTPGELATPINTAPVKATTYVDAPEYGEHEYRVAAVASAGPPSLQSDFSAPVKVTFKDLVPPPTPATITPLIETQAVRLIWDPVEAADLAGYRLYRSEGVGHENSIRDIGTVPLVAQPVTTTDYVDKGPNPGIAYKYAVTAVDKNGNESAKVWTGWVVVPKTP